MDLRFTGFPAAIVIFLAIYSGCDQETKTNNRIVKADKSPVTEQNQTANKTQQSQPQKTTSPTNEVEASPPALEDNGNNPKLELTWNANDEQNLTQYHIYIYTDNPQTAEKLQTVYVEENGFDSNYPKKEVIISSDYKGKTPCFMITAVNAGGESVKSDQSCIEL